jgi:hypothetical protein
MPPHCIGAGTTLSRATNFRQAVISAWSGDVCRFGRGTTRAKLIDRRS